MVLMAGIGPKWSEWPKWPWSRICAGTFRTQFGREETQHKSLKYIMENLH